MKKPFYVFCLLLLISVADRSLALASISVSLFFAYVVLYAVWQGLMVFVKTESKNEHKATDPFGQLKAEYRRRLAHIRTLPTRYQSAAREDSFGSLKIPPAEASGYRHSRS